ncbi:MAG: hypothetical protein ACI86M_001124 [Saprospiraceae bacterium]|jgi:hypothetical protein
MKTSILTILFFALTLNINAQETASVNPSIILDSAHSTKADVSTKVIRNNHNSTAKNQLFTFLSKNLAYSSFVRDNGLEGSLTLEVSISSTGLITAYSIVNSTNKNFDKIVMDIMLDLDRLSFKDKIYLGTKKIKVPINFSL